MTKHIPITQHQRPRRELGRMLRQVLRCPLCPKGGKIEVVAYRTRTTRFKCGVCGLRWSLDPVDVGKAEYQRLQDMPPDVREAMEHVFPGQWEAQLHRAHLLAFGTLLRAGQTEEERLELARLYREGQKRRRERLS